MLGGPDEGFTGFCESLESLQAARHRLKDRPKDGRLKVEARKLLES